MEAINKKIEQLSTPKKAVAPRTPTRTPAFVEPTPKKRAARTPTRTPTRAAVVESTPKKRATPKKLTAKIKEMDSEELLAFLSVAKIKAMEEGEAAQAICSCGNHQFFDDIMNKVKGKKKLSKAVLVAFCHKMDVELDAEDPGTMTSAELAKSLHDFLCGYSLG